jgi:hypothetical protein
MLSSGLLFSTKTSSCAVGSRKLDFSQPDSDAYEAIRILKFKSTFMEESTQVVDEAKLKSRPGTKMQGHGTY